MKRAAAIDLGTNTALLLVGELGAGGEVRVLADECRTVRLGEGLARSGRLAPAAIERALVALADYRERASGFGVERMRVAATAVLRRAVDAREFRALVRERLGLEIDVLPGEEEARLAHIAAARADGDLVIDVGGGSTEIVYDGGRERYSAPIGAVVLHETLPDVEFHRLEEAAREAMRAFPVAVAADRAVVVLGGTATNLACLVARLAAFDPLAAEERSVRLDDARHWGRMLHELPLAKRCAHPLEPERAEILPAGLACLAAAMSLIGADTARATGRGLRYALLRELLAECG